MLSLMQLNGQSVKNAEFYTTGNIYRYQSCNPQDVDVSQSGTALLWDFSTINTLAGTIHMEIIDPNIAPHSANYPNPNIVEKASDGTWVYSLQTASENRLLGFVSSSDNFEMEYSNPQLSMHRPQSLGDSITDTYSHDYSAGGYTFKSSGNTMITADAYGRLILPHAQFDSVLLLKMIQSQTDTMTQWSSVSSSTTTSYLWFAKGSTAPLLRWTKSESDMGTEYSASYLLPETNLGIMDKVIEWNLYPNPTSNMLHFELADLSKDVWRFQLIDLQGRRLMNEVIFSNQGARHSISLAHLPSGTYTCILSNTKGESQSSLIIKD